MTETVGDPKISRRSRQIMDDSGFKLAMEVTAIDQDILTVYQADSTRGSSTIRTLGVTGLNECTVPHRQVILGGRLIDEAVSFLAARSQEQTVFNGQVLSITVDEHAKVVDVANELDILDQHVISTHQQVSRSIRPERQDRPIVAIALAYDGNASNVHGNSRGIGKRFGMSRSNNNHVATARSTLRYGRINRFHGCAFMQPIVVVGGQSMP